MNSARKLVLLVSGLCASLAAAAAPGAATNVVTIYDPTQIALHRYSVVKRIGVQDWQSAFRIRGHGSLEAARQALANEAARIGADGLINVTCFDQTDRIFKPAGFFCYGNAIRVNK